MEINWRQEKRAVKDLRLWDKNPRTITKEGFEKLKERITKRGFHDVIKIDTDNMILSGNQKKRANEYVITKAGTKHCFYTQLANRFYVY